MFQMLEAMFQLYKLSNLSLMIMRLKEYKFQPLNFNNAIVIMISNSLFQLVCNGKGQCICGKCSCDEDSGYFGRTCEDCPVR